MRAGIRAVGLALALAGAVGGGIIAFGAWGVGYCGGLTPDLPSPGTLRGDLCRGASGDTMSGAVFAAWLIAAGAPLLGSFFAQRTGRVWPLAVSTVVGALPIAVVAILAATLPQS